MYNQTGFTNNIFRSTLLVKIKLKKRLKLDQSYLVILKIKHFVSWKYMFNIKKFYIHEN